MTPDELAQKIAARPFSSVAEELMAKVLDVVLPHVQSFTPVDTGYLRESEQKIVLSGGMRGFISTDTPYAIFQKVDFMQLGADASVGEVEGVMMQVGTRWLEVLVK